jgi:hypothetical protein
MNTANIKHVIDVSLHIVTLAMVATVTLTLLQGIL